MESNMYNDTFNSDRYDCKICFNENGYPIVMVPCGHSICDICEKNLIVKNCPLCQTIYTQIVPNRSIGDDILNKQYTDGSKHIHTNGIHTNGIHTNDIIKKYKGMTVFANCKGNYETVIHRYVKVPSTIYNYQPDKKLLYNHGDIYPDRITKGSYQIFDYLTYFICSGILPKFDHDELRIYLFGGNLEEYKSCFQNENIFNYNKRYIKHFLWDHVKSMIFVYKDSQYVGRLPTLDKVLKGSVLLEGLLYNDRFEKDVEIRKLASDINVWSLKRGHYSAFYFLDHLKKDFFNNNITIYEYDHQTQTQKVIDKHNIIQTDKYYITTTNQDLFQNMRVIVGSTVNSFRLIGKNETEGIYSIFNYIRQLRLRFTMNN